VKLQPLNDENNQQTVFVRDADILACSPMMLCANTGAHGDNSYCRHRYQMTLDEKRLLGGVDGFFIRDIPRLNLPRLKMADGPIGVHNFGLYYCNGWWHRADSDYGTPRR
jgi:hypothetical protein